MLRERARPSQHRSPVMAGSSSSRVTGGGKSPLFLFRSRSLSFSKLAARPRRPVPHPIARGRRQKFNTQSSLQGGMASCPKTSRIYYHESPFLIMSNLASRHRYGHFRPECLLAVGVRKPLAAGRKLRLANRLPPRWQRFRESPNLRRVRLNQSQPQFLDPSL